jgi:hypothetical protein
MFDTPIITVAWYEPYKDAIATGRKPGWKTTEVNLQDLGQDRCRLLSEQVRSRDHVLSLKKPHYGSYRDAESLYPPPPNNADACLINWDVIPGVVLRVDLWASDPAKALQDVLDQLQNRAAHEAAKEAELKAVQARRNAEAAAAAQEIVTRLIQYTPEELSQFEAGGMTLVDADFMLDHSGNGLPIPESVIPLDVRDIYRKGDRDPYIRNHCGQLIAEAIALRKKRLYEEAEARTRKAEELEVLRKQTLTEFINQHGSGVQKEAWAADVLKTSEVIDLFTEYWISRPLAAAQIPYTISGDLLHESERVRNVDAITSAAYAGLKKVRDALKAISDAGHLLEFQTERITACDDGEDLSGYSVEIKVSINGVCLSARALLSMDPTDD